MKTGHKSIKLDNIRFYCSWWFSISLFISKTYYAKLNRFLFQFRKQMCIVNLHPSEPLLRRGFIIKEIFYCLTT